MVHYEIQFKRHVAVTKWVAILSLFLSQLGCDLISGGDEPAPTVTPAPVVEEITRSFKLGFTPWPFAATFAAKDELYLFMDQSADMIAHHLDGGVPWTAAVTPDNFDNYGIDVKDEINDRVVRTGAMNSKEVYLAVSPFNNERDALALFWDTSESMPLPVPWDTIEFDNNFVISAYSNYVVELIKKFNPTHVNYAIEANEFYHNAPADRFKFIYFMANVYPILKAKYPNIKFMTSFTLKSPGSAEMIEAAEFFTAIKDYVDMVGVSVYPYVFFSHSDKGDPANLPDNWLSQIQTIAPGKPYYIAETGFIGESLSIPAFGLDVVCDEDKQAAYLEELFKEADALGVEGIVWFSAYDFDILWDDLLGDDISLIWRDTGLKDGQQQPRKALTNWNKWLTYQVQP